MSGAKKIVVAKGKKVEEFDPGKDDKDTILKKITGPTGNLRAPALRSGNEFYIGFNADVYRNL